MTFTFYLLVGVAVCIIMLPIVITTIICVDSVRSDPTYYKLKPKGKLKYFISQMMEVEF